MAASSRSSKSQRKSNNHWPNEDSDSSDYGDQEQQLYSKVELEEWDEVNKELRHHGFPTIKVVHPSKVGQLSGVVVMETSMAKSMRESFLTLMSDCDRRQELIQDLIMTNNQLKEDLRHQTSLAQKYETRAEDLKMMLDSSKAKLQELEDNNISKSQYLEGEGEKLRNTKNAIHVRCKQLETRCRSQTEEIDRLTEKLRWMNEEDERRRMRQNEIFQQFRKRTVRASNTLDDKLLDVIDAYEAQIHNLRKELDLFRKDGHGVNPEKDADFGATPNYKALIKAYEKQLREAKKKLKSAEESNEIYKLELDARPNIKEYRAAQQRMKKMEKLLSRHNISVPGEKAPSVIYVDETKYSTQIDDIDYLPLDLCRKYLRVTCDTLGVFDLAHIVPKIHKKQNAVEAFPRLEQFAKDVLNIVNSPKTPKIDDYKQHSTHKRSHAVWCERTWSHVLPTLELWKAELGAMRELQMSVNKLSAKLAPFTYNKLSSSSRMAQIIAAIDALTFEGGVTADPIDGHERPSSTVLHNIVRHFQDLFDVPTINGVYPRMNDIYTKLGEVHNVMRTLRDLLGLPDDARSSAIVDGVGRLCQQHNSTTYHQLRQLLQEEDVDTIKRKLEQYEELVPVFQEIMHKLTEILGISRLDQVVPAVRALKLLAG